MRVKRLPPGAATGLSSTRDTTDTITTWTVGGGIEWAIYNNWSIKGEYMWDGLTTCGFAAAPVVSRLFRTFGLAERRPALAHAVMAPLICWSFSNSMLRYLLVDHAVPAMWRSLAAARLSAD